MSSSTCQEIYPQSRPVLIHLDQVLRQKEKARSCIFCGQIHKTQNFKGKPVCLDCLHRILNLFPL